MVQFIDFINYENNRNKRKNKRGHNSKPHSRRGGSNFDKTKEILNDNKTKSAKIITVN